GDGFADGVLSTLGDDSGLPLAFTYVFYHGTSMAAPHMAGVVALMFAVNPTFTSTDLDQLLAGTHADPNAGPITQDLGAPGRDDMFGHGLIDAFQAVNVARAIAGGGGGNTPPPDQPVLAVSPESLNFGATTTSLQLTISNPGTAPLTIDTITTDQPWLALDVPNFPLLIDATNFVRLTITVERTGLPVGTFVGNISIIPMAPISNTTVPVALQVQAAITGGNVGTVFVRVVDPDTFETVGQAVTDVAQGYAYVIPDVPEGRYMVIAGTDRDNDDSICDNGEACGIFPLVDSPALVDVSGDASNVNFPVSYTFFAANAAGQMLTSRSQSFPGFRRLGSFGSRR
ncbi:MAG: S8 family serine peptidase, partial [Candidatus Tectomicrobia bacterium]